MILNLLKIFVSLFIISIIAIFNYKGILFIADFIKEFKETKDKQDKADLMLGIILTIAVMGIIFTGISFGLYNLWIEF